MLSSRKQAAIVRTAEEIRASGSRALPMAAHTGNSQAIQNLVAKAIETNGGIEIVASNAGTNHHFGRLLTAEESHWNKILDVNWIGYSRVGKAWVENMRQRGGGKIFGIVSIPGIQAQPWTGVYGVSKAGVPILSKVLALELAADDIQVNDIAPGFIRTEFTRALGDSSELNGMIVAQIPQERMGTPDEPAGIALYIASEASIFTAGAVFVVDNAQTLGYAGEATPKL